MFGHSLYLPNLSYILFHNAITILICKLPQIKAMLSLLIFRAVSVTKENT